MKTKASHHPVTFDLGNGEFIRISEGVLHSNLKHDGDGMEAYNAAIDGMEGTLLALACVGVTLDTLKVQEAVGIALEGICNHHTD